MSDPRIITGGGRSEHDRLARETAFNNLAYEARVEMRRQFAKWGEQNHPDGTGPDERWLEPVDVELGLLGATNKTISTPASALAAAATKVTDVSAAVGEVTWLHILFEEVAEAFAESDPAALRAELVQVAAVALQWAGAIDRRPSPSIFATTEVPAPIIGKPADEISAEAAAEEFDEDTMAVWGENEDGSPVDPEARAATEAEDQHEAEAPVPEDEAKVQTAELETDE